MEVQEWLDSKLEYENDLKHYTPIYNDITLYYNRKDYDIRKNDMAEIEDMRYFRDRVLNNEIIDKYYAKEKIRNSKYVNKFRLYNKDFVHYINQDTKRYLCSKLFNEMIDYCYINNILDFNNHPVIHKLMREKFYEFCYDYSF